VCQARALIISQCGGVAWRAERRLVSGRTGQRISQTPHDGTQRAVCYVGGPGPWFPACMAARGRSATANPHTPRERDNTHKTPPTIKSTLINYRPGPASPAYTPRISSLSIRRQLSLATCRPGHTKCLFSGQKKFEISGHQSHKKRVFCHFRRI